MPGTAVPDFSLPGTGDTRFELSRPQDAYRILYFYPKDNTAGCTIEAEQFRDLHPAFRAAGCAVYGVSRDSLKSHENFKARLGLPFELLSDADERVCRLFDVIKPKMMYGRQVRGIERSTFVLDRNGAIVRAWRGVKAPGHAQDVLDHVRSL